MGFIPDHWKPLTDVEGFPEAYLTKCQQQGICTAEELLGQCLAESLPTKEWLGCSDEEWNDLLVMLIGAVPQFAWKVWLTTMRIYGLGALPPEEQNDADPEERKESS